MLGQTFVHFLMQTFLPQWDRSSFKFAQIWFQNIVNGLNFFNSLKFTHKWLHWKRSKITVKISKFYSSSRSSWLPELFTHIWLINDIHRLRDLIKACPQGGSKAGKNIDDDQTNSLEIIGQSFSGLLPNWARYLCYCEPSCIVGILIPAISFWWWREIAISG